MNTRLWCRKREKRNAEGQRDGGAEGTWRGLCSLLIDMETDSVSFDFQIIFGTILAIYGLYYGVLKQELTIQLGRGKWGFPFTVTKTAAIVTGIVFAVGGGLLIVGAQPQESGLNQILSAIGCGTPIVVFVFSFLMQSLIDFGKGIHESREGLKPSDSSEEDKDLKN
jgi:hypothetical protein